MKGQVDVSRLSGIPLLPKQKAYEVNAFLKDGHKVRTIHEQNDGTSSGVSSYPVRRKAIDRQKDAKCVFELPTNLARKRVQCSSVDQFLLPLGLKKVVGTIEREGAINLLTSVAKRGLGIEIKQLEQVVHDALQLEPPTLHIPGHYECHVPILDVLQSLSDRRIRSQLLCSTTLPISKLISLFASFLVGCYQSLELSNRYPCAFSLLSASIELLQMLKRSDTANFIAKTSQIPEVLVLVSDEVVNQVGYHLPLVAVPVQRSED